MPLIVFAAKTKIKSADLNANFSGLADGSLINDGVITTAKIAASAVTQIGSSVLSAGGDSTTSGTNVQIAGLSVTLTTTGGDLIVFFTGGTFGNTVANSVTNIAIDLDGAATDVLYKNAQTASAFLPMAAIKRYTGVSAASHTIKIMWRTNTGTASIGAGVAESSVVVVELKK